MNLKEIVGNKTKDFLVLGYSNYTQFQNTKAGAFNASSLLLVGTIVHSAATQRIEALHLGAALLGLLGRAVIQNTWEKTEVKKAVTSLATKYLPGRIVPEPVKIGSITLFYKFM